MHGGLSEMIMHHILIQSKTIQMRICSDHSSLLMSVLEVIIKKNMHLREKDTNLIKRLSNILPELDLELWDKLVRFPVIKAKLVEHQLVMYLILEAINYYYYH